MSKDATPYEVLVDERVEKDLDKVPKYVVEKFLKLLTGFFILWIMKVKRYG